MPRYPREANPREALQEESLGERRIRLLVNYRHVGGFVCSCVIVLARSLVVGQGRLKSTVCSTGTGHMQSGTGYSRHGLGQSALPQATCSRLFLSESLATSKTLPKPYRAADNHFAYSSLSQPWSARSLRCPGHPFPPKVNNLAAPHRRLRGLVVCLCACLSTWCM